MVNPLGSRQDNQVINRLVIHLGNQVANRVASRLGIQQDTLLVSHQGNHLKFQLDNQVESRVDSHRDILLVSQLEDQVEILVLNHLDNLLEALLGIRVGCLQSLQDSQAASHLLGRLDSLVPSRRHLPANHQDSPVVSPVVALAVGLQDSQADYLQVHLAHNRQASLRGSLPHNLLLVQRAESIISMCEE